MREPLSRLTYPSLVDDTHSRTGEPAIVIRSRRPKQSIESDRSDQRESRVAQQAQAK